jgi:hypothetical protein
MTLKFNSQQEIVDFICDNAHDVNKMSELAAYYQSNHMNKNDAGLASSVNSELLTAQSGNVSTTSKAEDINEFLYFKKVQPTKADNRNAINVWEYYIKEIIRRCKYLPANTDTFINIHQVINHFIDILEEQQMGNSIDLKALMFGCDSLLGNNKLKKEYSLTEAARLTRLGKSTLTIFLDAGGCLGRKINGNWKVPFTEVQFWKCLDIGRFRSSVDKDI